MLLFALAFLLGDVYLQAQSILPDFLPIFLITISLALFSFFVRKKLPYAYILPALLAGYTWSLWSAQQTLSWTLPHELEGKPILVSGIIKSLPIKDDKQTHFLFEANNLNHATIRLNWQNAKSNLIVGDKWNLTVQLKRIHSTANPGAFDFEAWSLQNGLRASGRVVEKANNQFVEHIATANMIDQFRQAVASRLEPLLPHTQTSPWLRALIFGERSNIAQEDWQVLRRTGTNHLMAIAGLHIGLVAAFVHTVIAWCWRRSPFLLLRFPASKAGALAALIAAIFYSTLAGFSIPTKRACIMAVIFISSILRQQKISAWYVWSLTLLLVLIYNPLSVLTESFWLSFATIALIIFGMSGRVNPSGFWWRHGRVQWVIGFGLIPLSLFFFQECSLVSFLANSIAIPWLAFLILPFCLLSTLALIINSSLAAGLLWIADQSLSYLWSILTWFSHLSLSTWHIAIPHYAYFITSLFACFLLLLPAGFPGKYLGLLWFLPLSLYQAKSPKYGDAWMTLLDVGQGLSVVIQTKSHTLIYDTGPKWNDSGDMGEQVILPYLRTQHLTNIDAMIISHGDMDHRGGMQAILNAMPVQLVYSSVPDKIPANQKNAYCLAGMHWQWDGVNFSFLYPSPADLSAGNDSSCVLKIEAGNHRLLLTGDIEKRAELNLLSRQAPLQADIMTAPHHGSKTSGLPDFIAAVHPKYVLYATGYRNRYHFPHAQVMATYQQVQAQQLNTVDTGAIFFKLEQGRPLSKPESYRIQQAKYWQDIK